MSGDPQEPNPGPHEVPDFILQTATLWYVTDPTVWQWYYNHALHTVLPCASELQTVPLCLF